MRSNTPGFVHSQSLCHQSCHAKHMYDICGDVPEYWRQYLPLNEKEHNAKSIKNETEQNTRNCLYDFFESVSRIPCKCPKLCEETVYRATLKKTADYKKRILTFLTVYFEKQEIAERTELAAYDRTRFLADVGGLVGLLVGMSLLSVFEFLVCISLYAVDRLCLLILKCHKPHRPREWLSWPTYKCTCL